MSINPKVSVIIPVYKAEQYIEKCARSLFEQTLDDIEFIFIDDCTPDNSIDILKCLIRDYPHRKSQVKIIHNEENKGISTTRNIGLNNSTGEYIIHCDSDDWIDDDLYEKLYLKAIEEKSDIVLCDFIREESGNLKIRKEFLNENVEEYVKAILTTKLSPYLWNKLVSRNLYLKYNIFFPDEYLTILKLSKKNNGIIMKVKNESPGMGLYFFKIKNIGNRHINEFTMKKSW
jgi:glycosyltransferase involved in cell wall biosynthesis